MASHAATAAALSLFIIGFVLIFDGYSAAIGNPCTQPNPPQNCQTNSSSSTSTSSTSNTITVGVSSLSVGSTAPNAASGIPGAIQVDGGNPAFGLIVSGLAVGSVHTVGAISPITYQGSTYVFASWSDGGAQFHSVTITTSPLTLTANYNIQLITPQWGLTVNTISSTGAPLQGQISVDGKAAGIGTVSIQVPIGGHTVTCAALNGYNSPAVQNIILGNYQQANPLPITCVYIPTAVATTQVIVNVQICSNPPGSRGVPFCFADTVDNAVLDATAILLTSTSFPYGTAIFTVPQNSQHSLTIQSVYGTYSQSLNVGTSTLTVPLITFYAGQGLSVVQASILGSASPSSYIGPTNEIAAGGVTMLFAFVILAISAKSKQEVA